MISSDGASSDGESRRRGGGCVRHAGGAPGAVRVSRPAVACAMVALALLAGAGEAFGAGFALQEQQSVRSVGRAHAGQAAIAEDASTVFYNPAGMTELERAQAEIGAHVITPHSELDDRASTATTPGSGGLPVAPGGNDGSNPFNPTPVLNLYVAAPLPGDRFWVGFGMTAPFGLSVKYDNTWFGRYDSTKTELLTLDLAPTVAYRVSDLLSVGAGIDIQYADGTLANAVPNPLAVGGPTPATDGDFKAEADDWSVGFNLGVLVKPTPRTRIGLNYRSIMTHDLEGDTTTTGLTGALAGLNGVVPASAELNLPDVASVAVAHELTGQLTLLAHVGWVGWGRYDELRIRFANGLPDAVTTYNYEDTWNAGVGFEYAYSDTWQFRGGFQFDETPTETGFRDTRVPDETRYWFSAGASYAINDRWGVDLAFAHVLFDDAEIDLTRTFFASVPAAASTADINARAETSVDIVSIQARAQF